MTSRHFNSSDVTKNAVSRTETFAAKTSARERKNERSSSSIERDAVEKRRDDAAHAR